MIHLSPPGRHRVTQPERKSRQPQLRYLAAVGLASLLVLAVASPAHAKPAVERGGALSPAVSAPAQPNAAVALVAVVTSAKARAAVSYALAQRGDRYRWASAGPNSFDCSGLVVAAYRHVGIRLPHQSRALLGRGWKVSRANLRAGDIVWLQPQRGSRGHVGIYVGGGNVVEASSSRGRVVVRPLGSRFWTARRVV